MSTYALRGVAHAEPIPDTIFSLVPTNNLAVDVLMENKHYVSAVEPSGKLKYPYGLNIGRHIHSSSRHTLAIIGRKGDVKMPGRVKAYSKKHCSFDVVEDSGAIMLQDLSTRRRTQVLGDEDNETVFRIEACRAPRRVLVSPTVNLEISLGGAEFRLLWHQVELNLAKTLPPSIEAPEDARTLSNPDTEFPIRCATENNSRDSQPDERVRYVKQRFLEQAHLVRFTPPKVSRMVD